MREHPKSASLLNFAVVALGAWVSYPACSRAATARTVNPRPGSQVVRIVHGSTKVDFRTRVHLDYRRTSRGRGGHRTMRFLKSFKPVVVGTRGHWRLAERLRFGPAELELAWTGRPGFSVVRLDVVITYRRKTFVRTEALEFVSPCSGMRFLHRNESFVAARPYVRYRVGRWTHKFAEVTRADGTMWALLEAGGISGMGAMLLKPRRGPSHCRLLLELDDSRNHPALYASRCKRWWYPPSPRLPRSRRLRFPGEKVKRRFWFRLGRGIAVHKLRLPSGFRAAVVFADHADQSAPGPLRAVLLGRSDATFKAPAGGFVGNGLHFTKTLFMRRGPYPQMENAAVRRMALKAHRRGIEFGPHSATPRVDSRTVTEQALALFKAYGSTWIDHQPDTNCEAYSCRGWNPKSPYFVSDLLLKHGFRYVWTGQDAKLGRGRINMLRPGRPGARASFFFPFHALGSKPSRLWLFRSVWFYEGPDRFARRLSAAALGRLIRERGIFIAHTYLDAHHGPRHRRHRLALVRRNASGMWALHPKAQAVLARMGKLQRAGQLWVPSIRELADHLTAWNNLTLAVDHPVVLTLANPGRRAVANLTFRVYARVAKVRGARARIVHGRGYSDVTVTVPASRNLGLMLLKPDGRPLVLVR